MDILIETDAGPIKQVDSKKRYWFIRTFAGEAFDLYKEGEFVGLGLNKVPLRYIRDVNDASIQFKELQTYIDKNTDYKKAEATKWAKQLISFVNEISVGDTVVIPSVSSERLAFGTIMSDMYLVDRPQIITHRGKQVPLPEKRYKVEWQKEILRDSLQGDLKNLLATHQGLTNADQYFEPIEAALENIFKRGDNFYIVIRIGKDEDINAFEFQKFLRGLTYFYKEFCIEEGLSDTENLTIKIKMQSKGKALLKGFAVAGAIGLLGLITLSDNSQFEYDTKTGKISGKSDGFLKSLTKFLDRNQERKMEWERFKDSTNNLKVQNNPNLDVNTPKVDSTTQSVSPHDAQDKPKKVREKKNGKN